MKKNHLAITLALILLLLVLGYFHHIGSLKEGQVGGPGSDSDDEEPIFADPRDLVRQAFGGRDPGLRGQLGRNIRVPENAYASDADVRGMRGASRGVLDGPTLGLDDRGVRQLRARVGGDGAGVAGEGSRINGATNHGEYGNARTDGNGRQYRSGADGEAAFPPTRNLAGSSQDRELFPPESGYGGADDEPITASLADIDPAMAQRYAQQLNQQRLAQREGTQGDRPIGFKDGDVQEAGGPNDPGFRGGLVDDRPEGGSWNNTTKRWEGGRPTDADGHQLVKRLSNDRDDIGGLLGRGSEFQGWHANDGDPITYSPITGGDVFDPIGGRDPFVVSGQPTGLASTGANSQDTAGLVQPDAPALPYRAYRDGFDDDQRLGAYAADQDGARSAVGNSKFQRDNSITERVATEPVFGFGGDDQDDDRIPPARPPLSQNQRDRLEDFEPISNFTPQDEFGGFGDDDTPPPVPPRTYNVPDDDYSTPSQIPGPPSRDDVFDGNGEMDGDFQPDGVGPVDDDMV